MSSFAQQAETQKLARLLGLSPEKVGFLEKLEPTAVRRLREQATRALYDADRAAFERAAGASRVMPTRLLALLAKKALGPLLCARIAGLMPVAKAMDIAERLDTDFLARLCLELDPRSARPLIAAMPPVRIAEVAVELARRNEFITMGRFVDSLKPVAIREVLKALTDDEAVLRIAFFVEDKDRLDTLVQLLPDERLRRIVRWSATHAELWPEGLGLMSSLEFEQRQRLADLAGSEDETTIFAMVRATQQHGLWPQLLPIVALMSETGQQRVSRLAEAWDDDLLLSVAQAAHAHQQWQTLLGLFAQMREEAKPRLITLARRLSPEQARELKARAKEKGLWDKLGELRDVLVKLG